MVKRLREAGRVLTKDALARLRKEARRYQGKPYDLTFEWSDDRIYCSELVWKIYDRGLGIKIGKVQKLKDFNLSDRLVQRTMKERYGADLPLEESVISPGEMFDAPNLQTVITQ